VLRTGSLPEGEGMNVNDVRLAQFFFLSLRERMKVRVFVIKGEA